jgi:hypothetical protein
MQSTLSVLIIAALSHCRVLISRVVWRDVIYDRYHVHRRVCRCFVLLGVVRDLVVL